MARDNGSNLIFLTIYIIGITYTFNRMIDSIDDKVKYIFDKEKLNEHLKQKEIQDAVGISFKLNSSYDLDDLKELSFSIENKSNDLAIYVDWDSSTLIYKNQSRRVIRKSPDLTRDLAVPQIPSVIAPTKTLSAVITAEDVFQKDLETGTYKINSPLINISGLGKSPVKADKALYKNFMDGNAILEFSLQLVLRISELRVGIAPGENKPPMYIIDCPFTIRKLPWTYALPWNKKR